MRRSLAATFLLCASSALAQTPAAPAIPAAAASSFATTEVRLIGRSIGGNWAPRAAALAGPSRIVISYGQPHARGRAIIGQVVPFDSVWRLGANLATTLQTDVDMTLGGTFLPHGVYSLYALPTKDHWQLIINKQVGQWGTDYDATQDVARIPLHLRTLADPIESLSIYLIPAVDPQGAAPTTAHGVLKIVWEKTELTTDWKVGR
jgi:hypothetical protein